MNKEDFHCCICHDLVYDPVTLSCGHTLCFSDIGELDSCPECRKKINEPPSINIMLNNILKASFPQDFERRKEECNIVNEINSTIKKYKASQRYQLITEIISSVISKTCLASFDELIEACQDEIMKRMPGFVFLEDEVKVICYINDSKKWGVKEWGIYSGVISGEKWLNYVLAYFSRNRQRHTSPPPRMITDRATKLDVVYDFKMNEAEKLIFVDMVFAREAHMTSFMFPRYLDITQIITSNSSFVPQTYKSNDWIYPRIKGFQDIPSTGPMGPTGPMGVPLESQSSSPNMDDADVAARHLFEQLMSSTLSHLFQVSINLADDDGEETSSSGSTSPSSGADA